MVAPIEYHREIAAPEIRYVRARTRRRVKATLPAPYIIGRRMWHPEHSRAAYPTRERLMQDCVGVLRREIEAVRAAGADTVQLDEPWLATLVDPRFRAEEGIADVRYEMDLCADLLNQTLDGLDGIETAVHLCHAHFARQHKTEGSYDLIMPALARVRAGTISLELATPVRGRARAPWRTFPPRRGSGSAASTTVSAGSRRWTRSWRGSRGRCATSTRRASCSIRTAASPRPSRTPWTSTRRTRSSGS